MKIPREISQPTKYLLDRGVLITATLTSDRYNDPIISRLIRNSLQPKSHYCIQWKRSVYSELVGKIFCEPGEDMSVRSFFEPENNTNLLPKRRKATEKKTPLPKSVNIKIFTKILIRQEAHLKLNATISIFQLILHQDCSVQFLFITILKEVNYKNNFSII